MCAGFGMDKRLTIIAGAYGVGNLGDEAILSGTLQLLESGAYYNRNSLIVFSRNPDETTKLHRVRAKRRNLIDLLNSGRIIIGGGELFQNQGRMAMKYSLLGIISKMLGKNVMYYAIGVSSDLGRLGRALSRLGFNLADGISVRDEKSKKRLVDLGVKKKITVIEDPSFYVKPVSEKEAVLLLEKEGVHFDKTKINMVVTSQFIQNKELNDKIYSFLFDFLMSLLTKNSDVQVFFAPFNNHMDKPLDKDVIYGKWLEEQLKNDNFRLLENSYSPSEMMGVFGLMDVILSTRLHPLILGTKMKVSAVAIGLFDKTISFCRHHNVPLVKVTELERIPRLINHLIESKRKSDQF